MPFSTSVVFISCLTIIPDCTSPKMSIFIMESFEYMWFVSIPLKEDFLFCLKESSLSSSLKSLEKKGFFYRVDRCLTLFEEC